MNPTRVRFWLSGALGVLLVASLAVTSGCAELNQMLRQVEGVGGGGGGAAKALNPTVSASPMQLVRYPTMRQLGAYYCPVVIRDQIARLGCAVALGPQPPRDQLVFQFSTTITVKNPNNIPVPALDILVALKLFNGQAAEGIGAVCMSMCGTQDPSCTGQAKPGACTAGGPGIRTVNDFVAAVPGLIAGLASGAVQSELRKSQIAARGDVSLNLTFSLGIDQALRIIEKVVGNLVQDQLQRRNAALEIPVSGEGTVFVQLPIVGRVGVGFGPLQTSWRIL
jgi:hypothetical protein